MYDKNLGKGFKTTPHSMCFCDGDNQAWKLFID